MFQEKLTKKVSKYFRKAEMAELVHQVPASAGLRRAGDHVVFSNILPVTKYQKNEGDPLVALRNFRKRKKRILKCHRAKKCKRKEPSGFLNIHSVAKYQKKLKGILWVQSKIFGKKFHTAEKS